MHDKSTKTERVCQNPACGKTFYRKASLPFRFCSRPCYYAGRTRPLADRFWEKVDRRGPDDCWPWLGTQDGHGYGQMGVSKGKTVKAYRISYELSIGPIPKDLLVRHTCERKICVNFAHLTLGTHTDNLLDRYRLGRAMTVEPRAPQPYPDRIERICPVCGLFFYVSAGVAASGKGKYCSYPHYVIARYGESDIERFWSKVDKTAECWLWTGCRHEFGYGMTAFRGIQSTAHRVAWIITNGLIPKGLVVCHNCPGGDQPLCVRPDHMFLGTRTDNALDASRKGRVQKGDEHFSRRHPELRPRGERIASAKLTADLVREIRRRAAAGETQQHIADDVGVTQTNITHIVHRRSWKHVV